MYLQNRGKKMFKDRLSTKVFSTFFLSATLLFGCAGEAQAALFGGTSSGSWVLPDGIFGADLLDADGGTNNRIEWGTPVNSGEENNSLQYDGLNFDVDQNTSFAIGNLTYNNGVVRVGSHNFDGDFSLDVSVSFTNPVTDTEIFNYAFNIFETINNTGDPVLDGDILSFANDGLALNTFSFDGVDYTLQLLGFSNDGGNTILSEFNLPENATVNPLLYARITAAPNHTSVPEPTVLLGCGFLGIYFATSRLKGKNSGDMQG
jgi:hypothetical protein